MADLRGGSTVGGHRILSTADRGAANGVAPLDENKAVQADGGLKVGTTTVIQSSGYIDWARIGGKPDPTITLTGDVTGSGTMTDLGSVTITTAVADNSHNHNWSNITNLPSPTITLSGAVSGSGTMTNLGNVTITTTLSSPGGVQSVNGKTGAVTLTAADVGALPLGGGTLTGALTLASNPTQSLHAATKSYVDNKLSSFLSSRQTFAAGIQDGDADTDVSFIRSVQLPIDTRTATVTYSNGQIASITECSGSTTVKTTTFTRNADGRITKITEAAGGKTVTTTLNYNADGTFAGYSRAVS